MPTLWTQRYAQRTQHMHRSALDDLLRPTEPSSLISFAGGRPATELLPLTEVQTACLRPWRSLVPVSRISARAAVAPSVRRC
jgi:DNA-binding transcriptional MocR family regulator